MGVGRHHGYLLADGLVPLADACVVAIVAIPSAHAICASRAGAGSNACPPTCGLSARALSAGVHHARRRLAALVDAGASAALAGARRPPGTAAPGSARNVARSRARALAAAR